MPLPLEQSIPAAESITLGAHDPSADVVSIVATWHDDTHPDAWRNCGLQPCDAVRRYNDQFERSSRQLTIEASSW